MCSRERERERERESKRLRRFVKFLFSFVLLVFVLIFSTDRVHAAYQPIRVLFGYTPPTRLVHVLDYYNIPYDVNTSFTENDILGHYSTIVLAGATSGAMADDAHEAIIKDAVQNHGVGLVYCGPTSTDVGRDPTILSLFYITAATWLPSVTAGNLQVTDNSHFITQNYTEYPYLWPFGQTYALSMGGITSYTPSGGYPKFLATQMGDSKQALIISQYGSGRAVWFNFRCDDGTGTFSQGSIAGAFLNSLIWTSQPVIGDHFAFSTIPSYFTMRVDDVQGASEDMFSISDANGLKLSSMLFTTAVNTNASYLSRLQTYYNKNQGMGVHAKDNSDVYSSTTGHYFWKSGGITEPDITNSFNQIQSLFSSWGFRQPTTFVPSKYDINNSVFPTLASRGIQYLWGVCPATSDGINADSGGPFWDTNNEHMDVWIASLSTTVYCFNQRRPGGNAAGESLVDASITNDIASDKINLEWAIRNYVPIILFSHEYTWPARSSADLTTWITSLTSYLDQKIPGWSSLAGDFLAPIIVQHKNINVDSAQYDSIANKYQITVSGTNSIPVPVTIYEPGNNIKGWDGIKEIIKNGDYYYLFVPAGTGSRTYTVDLDSGTPTSKFGYIYKTDTYIQSTTDSGLGMKVDPYDFGTLNLKGYGGGVTRGSTTIQANGSFTGSVTMSDGSEQWALVPMTIIPSSGSLDVAIDTWNSSGNYYKKWTESGSSSDIQTTHTVGDLNPNTTYDVKVGGEFYTRATANNSGQITFIYSGGYSTKTFEVQESPGPDGGPQCNDTAPTGPTPWLYKASANNGNSITIRFTNWQSPVDHFALEYGTSSNNYQFGATNIGGNGTNSYTVNLLSPNTTYYFRVMAGNGCATGPWSNELSTKTLGFISTNNLNITNTTVEQVPAQTGTAGTQNNLPGQVEVSTGKYTVNIIVKDTAGNVIENATVTLSSPFSVTQTGTTNKDGVATFNNVEAGNYTVDITYNNMQASESINLAGDVKEFNINVTVQQKAVLLSPLAYGVIGIMGVVIAFIAFKLIKRNKIKKL